MKAYRRTTLLGLAALSGLAGLCLFYAVYGHSAEGWGRYTPASAAEGQAEHAVEATFLGESADPSKRYEALFTYFLHGITAHATPDFAAIHYPGMGSIYGYKVNGLEGFARTVPLFAAWIHSGRNPLVTDPETGNAVDLVALIRRGLLAGTDPASPSYWGDMGKNDQRIVEAPDIARTLWLTRTRIWDRLAPGERQQIASWLLEINRAPMTYENNWLLFSIVVNAVLHDLGAVTTPVDLANYWHFKASYRESGWFSDPPEGVDYYNTWASSYELYWIHTLDPAVDPDFIVRVLNDSAGLTAHLIGPQGIPILGRSICYRTAISVPLLVDNLIKGTDESAGRARRGLDVTWRYFIAHGSLRDGALTQGYFGPDPRFVDAYTGTGSCNWGLRSLVLAFMMPPETDIFTRASAPLPVELGDYRLDLPKLGWTVIGTQKTGNISIVIAQNALRVVHPAPYSGLAKLKEFILRHPARPENRETKYELHEYASLTPYPQLDAGK
jgi:hypothetical protein